MLEPVMIFRRLRRILYECFLFATCLLRLSGILSIIEYLQQTPNRKFQNISKYKKRKKITINKNKTKKREKQNKTETRRNKNKNTHGRWRVFIFGGLNFRLDLFRD